MIKRDVVFIINALSLLENVNNLVKIIIYTLFTSEK